MDWHCLAQFTLFKYLQGNTLIVLTNNKMESFQVLWNHTSLTSFMESMYNEENLSAFAVREGLEHRSEIAKRLSQIRKGEVSF